MSIRTEEGKRGRDHQDVSKNVAWFIRDAMDESVSSSMIDIQFRRILCGTVVRTTVVSRDISFVVRCKAINPFLA